MAPTKVTVKGFLLDEWLPPSRARCVRPPTPATDAGQQHIIPRLGSLQLQKLTPGAINALYAHLGEQAAFTAAVRSRPPRCAACTPSCTALATTPYAGAASR